MRTRRRLDPDTRWRIMQTEAYRHMGRKYATWIVMGPYIVRALVLAVVVAGLMLAWLKVDHGRLGFIALALAAVLGVGWLVVTNSNAAVQRRMVNSARGGNSRPGLGLGWAVAGAVFMLAGTGYLALWSPWA
jgi:hypothetical protein